MQGGSCAENAALVEAVNQTGRAFLSHTELGGVYTLRFAVSGAQTQVGLRVRGQATPLCAPSTGPDGGAHRAHRQQCCMAQGVGCRLRRLR